MSEQHCRGLQPYSDAWIDMMRVNDRLRDEASLDYVAKIEAVQRQLDARKRGRLHRDGKRRPR